ncbi:uncharacterized protein LOC123679793 [Harmonia axyridis]|uniref:uncharacterized protein LOC123679793 n=1 Tax=Harmonia axyridis TaxID=115357 RepID=UPI001E275C90|nr:uncharacterized protein LOC123679793 [Harmonia axyridis]
MTILVFIVLFSLVLPFSQESDVQTIDLLELGTYKWEGPNSNSAIIEVTATNYSISVTIEKCNIGNPEARPNNEYLILKNGCEDSLSTDNGRILVYIKKPKTFYFFSSSVILQLETPGTLTKECTVTFEKGDVENTTPPPVTTTEAVTTYGPEVAKYSTVFISGRPIDEFNQNKSLVQVLRDSIVAMATEYTNDEGFCLTKKIKSDDVVIYTLEQCPTQWPDFQNCIRLVYAVPVKTNKGCTLWKGYQLSKEHLDLMWSRLALKYLSNGFTVYKQPEINDLLTWWVVCMILLTLLFAITIISINLVWKRRQFLKRAQTLNDRDYTPNNRKISEESLTPPYFQPIPPMFGKADSFDEQGLDNEGFQYNPLSLDENRTSI